MEIENFPLRADVIYMTQEDYDDIVKWDKSVAIPINLIDNNESTVFHKEDFHALGASIRWII